MAEMSIIDRPVANFPSCARWASVSCRSLISAQSNEVPPISAVTTSLSPSRSASDRAPTTPPTGPELISSMGSPRASSGDSRPPTDCISAGRTAQPSSDSLASRAPTYSATPLDVKALNTVVTSRSYSRATGNTSLEMETNSSG